MLQENQLFANRYRLVKRLGQGAFSEVWKAEDTKAGNLTVALKVYAPDKGLDEDGAKVFSDEFAIVFNVHHSNLLTPNYFDEENNSPYLVLPFCEQGSALKLVGKMGERQVAQFLHDVAAALAYLHGKGIVHQDIKPDNVLMDSEGTFLVTDFGISTRIRSTLRRSVGDKKSAGTMAYMGPERFSKNPDPIKASDIWSLGSTVFELMKGDVPFGDMGGGMQMAGALVPDIPGNYSASLKQLVELCLSKETWDRPTAEQLRDICDGYLRTGAWNLSSLNKSGTQEIEKLKVSVGRPTERKVMKPNLSLEYPKNKSESLAKLKKWIPLSLFGIAVTISTVLIVSSWSKRTVIPNNDSGTYTINGVKFNMIHVEGGTFQIAEGYDRVHVNDYCMGETEVTQSLWKAVMGDNPSHFKGNNRPVENVSWNDCQEFIRKLNSLTGKNFCLPTKVEWDYAARGGNRGQNKKYAGSNTLEDVAWFNENSHHKSHSVKKKYPNELGLYDMSGNVWEWCQDRYEPLNSHYLRGGDWYSCDGYCEVLIPIGGFTPESNSGNGFRLAISKHRDASRSQNKGKNSSAAVRPLTTSRCFKISK